MGDIRRKGAGQLASIVENGKALHFFLDFVAMLALIIL
jgi:hypothetical protein